MRNSFLNGSVIASPDTDQTPPIGKRVAYGGGGGGGGTACSTTPPKHTHHQSSTGSNRCSQSTLAIGDSLSSSLLSSGLRKCGNLKRVSGSGTTVDGSQLSLKLQNNLIQSVKKSLAKTKRQWDRTGLIHIIYIFVLLTYSFVGGALFMYLDGPHADRILLTHRNRCNDLRDELWTRLITNCTHRSFSDCENMTRTTMDILSECFRTSPQLPFNHSTSNYWNSLIYAITVFTTIGYGNIVVLSTEGRVAMILYAMIGIPLFFAFLNDMGQWFHFKFLRIYDWVRQRVLASRLCKILLEMRRRRAATETAESALRKQKEQHKVDRESHDGLIFTFAVAVLVFYLVVVCGLFMAMVRGQWSFLQAFYFIFQSISLIGFGDEFPDNPNVVLINIIFIIIGIILLSMCFFILQEWIRGKTYRLSTQVRRSVRRWRHYRPANNGGVGDRRRTGVRSTRFTVPLPHLGSGNDRAWRRSRSKMDSKIAGQRLAVVDDSSPGPGRRSLAIRSLDSDEPPVVRRTMSARRDGVNSTDETLLTGRKWSSKEAMTTSADAETVTLLSPITIVASLGAGDRRHTFGCLDQIPASIADTSKRRISWLDLQNDAENEDDTHNSHHKRHSLMDRPARFGKFQWIGKNEDEDDDDEDEDEEEDEDEPGGELDEEILDQQCVFIIDDEHGADNEDASSYCEKDEYL